MLHDSQAKWLNKSTSLCNAAISLFTHLSHGDNMGVFTFADGFGSFGLPFSTMEYGLVLKVGDQWFGNNQNCPCLCRLTCETHYLNAAIVSIIKSATPLFLLVLMQVMKLLDSWLTLPRPYFIAACCGAPRLC